MSYLAFLSLQTSALFMRENGDSLLSLIGSYVATHITGAREQKRMVVRSLRSLQAFDLGKAYSQMLLIRRTFTHQRDIKEASKRHQRGIKGEEKGGVPLQERYLTRGRATL